MDTNKINVEKVTTALSEIETSLISMSNNFDSVNNVSATLNNAWSSENSTLVANKVSDIYEKLSLLETSVDNLKIKVRQVVSNIEKADKVSFSGGTSSNSTAQ